MRFLSIYKAPEQTAPPTPEHLAKMQRLIDESMKRGELLATEGCLPTAFGARVRIADGEITVTDGPFAETKEVIGGFAILQASSREQAIAQARQFLQIMGSGECEVRQLFDAPGAAAGDAACTHAALTEQFG
jgi:hypothetical protein